MSVCVSARRAFTPRYAAPWLSGELCCCCYVSESRGGCCCGVVRRARPRQQLPPRSQISSDLNMMMMAGRALPRAHARPGPQLASESAFSAGRVCASVRISSHGMRLSALREGPRLCSRGLSRLQIPRGRAGPGARRDGGGRPAGDAARLSRAAPGLALSKLSRSLLRPVRGLSAWETYPPRVNLAL